MLHAISHGIIIYGLWLILSGHYTPFFLITGFVCTVFVVLLSMRMDIIDHDYQPLMFGWKLLLFFPWLIYQIILSNLMVTRCILSPRSGITPVVVNLKGSQTSELGKMVYANSITLTPGTLTMNVEGSDFEVHALLKDAADDLAQGEMNRRITVLLEKQ